MWRRQFLFFRRLLRCKHTDKIDDYVLNGSLKTNLNVAITYDEENDITEVYMATPFMNEDY